jgi:antitoxin (DNA-binding transcriptional repressor) of toxin-antitoxin stability system
MLTKIKRFLTSPWRAAELEDELETLQRHADRLEINLADVRGQLAGAPSFVGAALRDGKLGEEIVTAVKKEAVAKLAPALSEEYAKMLNQIAWTLPPPRSRRYDNPGMALTAYDERHEVYHVRVEIPQLNYEMKVAS